MNVVVVVDSVVLLLLVVVHTWTEVAVINVGCSMSRTSRHTLSILSARRQQLMPPMHPLLQLHNKFVLCLITHHSHRAVADCSVTSPHCWPRLCAGLQSSAGVWAVSLPIWSSHLPRGRPGLRLQEESGGRPRDELTWIASALWAGTLSCSLAMCPKTEMRLRLMMSKSYYCCDRFYTSRSTSSTSSQQSWGAEPQEARDSSRKHEEHEPCVGSSRIHKCLTHRLHGLWDVDCQTQ